MKYLLSFLCFLFLCNRVFAQQAVDTSGLPGAGLKLSVSTLSRTTIQFRNPRNTFYPGQFNHFEVIDERADTARIGIHARTGPFSHSQRQLVFGRPASTEIAEYLNAHFSRRGTPFTALLVLRTFWLSDANYTREDLAKDPDKKLDNFQIRLKAEVYAGDDSLYIPVFRYDTLVTTRPRDYESREGFYPMLEDRLSNLFNDLADSASLVAGHKAVDGRKVSREQIREFNRSRFSLPTDSGTAYAAGVYASFEEFRNNAPSIHDFEIKTEGKEIPLYIKSATGPSYYSHDVWGYSDGHSLYIMKNGMLCPAWKEGKAIYFYGISYIMQSGLGGSYFPGTPGVTTPGGAMVGGTPGYYAPNNTSSEKEVKFINTVDMDTGEVY
jgi:hypothetical protein